MKKTFKTIAQWLGLSALMLICWMTGMALGVAIFPTEFMKEASEADSSFLILFFTSALNTGALLYFVKHSKLKGWKLVGLTSLIGFGLMFFMSQIETLWFNDSVQFPLKGILSLVTGGAIMYILFSILITWLTGNFKASSGTETTSEQILLSDNWKSILIISTVIWPFLYYFAGYFVAWQFEAVRIFYTGSAIKEPFLQMFPDFFTSGLYFFQIFRGFIWVLLAILIFKYINGTPMIKGTSLVLLLVMLCCSQLLLPNPFMPDGVRIGHLVETSLENAILGIVITWMLLNNKLDKIEKSHPVLNV